MDMRTSCIRKIIFFNGPFAYGDGGILKLLRWMKNLHHSTWYDASLCADRSSDDEQLSIRPFLQEIKEYEYGERLIVKIQILFYEENS
jgi:hypothetical protein